MTLNFRCPILRARRSAIRLPLLIIALMLALSLAGGVSAGILYRAEERAIELRDYPAGRPCTPADIYRMDMISGWGVMDYDAARDVYTLKAHLRIGANDGTETHFQIGDVKHPTETLVMRGNLIVAPCWIKGQNEGEWFSDNFKRVNRLSLGAPGNTNITAALLFDPATNAAFGLFIGAQPQTNGDYRIPGAYGGQLHVHYSRISSARPGPDSMAGWRLPTGRVFGFMLSGTPIQDPDTVVLDNATLSRIAGGMTYGMQFHNSRVVNTVFENGGQALVNGRQKALGCVFRNLESAVVDEGSLDAELTDCVFKENDRNWSLVFSKKGLTLVDCEWDAPKKGDMYRVWTNKQGEKQYPKLIVRRHVVVEVKDGSGKPVPGAAISFRAEQDGNAPQQAGLFKTGKDGRTPGRGHDNALALTAYVKTATDTPDQPALASFTYTLTAEKDGRSAVVTNVVADTSWKTVTLTIQ